MNRDLTADFDLHSRSDLHLSRKIWHVSTVSTMTLIYIYAPERITYTILFLALIVFLPIDFYRQFHPGLNRRMVSMMRLFIRKSEVNNLAGTTYLLTGVAALAIFFPRRVIELTLMFLAFADPIASLIGIRFGSDRLWGKKSIQGFGAAFVTCFLISLFYFYWTNMLTERWILASLLAGLIGAIAELVQFGKLDDNFSLPIISGCLLTVLYYAFGVY